MRRRKSWLKPLTHCVTPCLCCGDTHTALPEDFRIAVGFGDARLTCNGKTVWQEESGMDREDCLTVHEAELLAAARDRMDWRIVLYGPLRGRTYQRQGAGNWVLVEQNEGFA